MLPRWSISKSIRGKSAAPHGAAALAAAAVGTVAGVATPASAHGFGERYDLPLPLSLYLVGAAAVVALSFVVVGLFVRRTPARPGPSVELLRTSFARRIVGPSVLLPIRIAALAVFAVTLLAGFIGDQNPYRNIAPTMVWTIGWVGLAFVSAFVGNVWNLINPWRTLFEAADRLARLVGHRRGLSLRLPYPAALGQWPACLLLLAFSWMELVDPDAAEPAHIARAALGYSILTWIGMFAFGSEAWLRNGEVFSVVFGLFARFAPIEARPGEEPQGRQLVLRPFGTGLIEGSPVSTSAMAMVLLLLASVLYDGLIGTPEWLELEGAARSLAPGLGEGHALVIRSIGLVAFWLLFLAIYLAVSTAMSVMTGRRRSARELAQGFALTLLPIAVGYHVAHYLAYLLIQGQYIVPLLSDPFGYGWNLFGTAAYRVDIAIVGARFAWYAALAAIVLGHVTAVYLAHAKAMRIFADRPLALRSQVPLTALMVVYTFIGLSIAAEPLAERRAPAEPAADSVLVPPEAVLPEAGSGRLKAVGAGKTAAQKSTYRVLASAFHDGTRMTPADILHAYSFAYRWGARGEGDQSQYDRFIDDATRTMRRRLVGLQVVGIDAGSRSFKVGDVAFVRELIAIDVYTAMRSQDPEQEAAAVAPWSTLPWHLIVLMEEAVSRGWAAFSQGEAARRNIEWLDLVRSELMRGRLESLVAEFERAGHRPESLQSLVSEDDARRRWAALAAFYQEHRHFLVANGPYRLKRWSAESAVLEAFRDLTYPLGVGSYDAYAIPRRGYVTKGERSDAGLTLHGDIEIVHKFQRSYRLVRAPLQSVPADVLKRAAPECRYTVLDGQGRVVLAGVARLGPDAAFRIGFDRLPAGRYDVSAAIALNGNVMNAEIWRTSVVISSDRSERQ